MICKLRCRHGTSPRLFLPYYKCSVIDFRSLAVGSNDRTISNQGAKTPNFRAYQTTLVRLRRPDPKRWMAPGKVIFLRQCARPVTGHFVTDQRRAFQHVLLAENTSELVQCPGNNYTFDLGGDRVDPGSICLSRRWQRATFSRIFSTEVVHTKGVGLRRSHTSSHCRARVLGVATMRRSAAAPGRWSQSVGQAIREQPPELAVIAAPPAAASIRPESIAPAERPHLPIMLPRGSPAIGAHLDRAQRLIPPARASASPPRPRFPPRPASAVHPLPPTPARSPPVPVRSALGPSLSGGSCTAQSRPSGGHQIPTAKGTTSVASD